jgi:predicted CXXCH cytochrome family protein
MKLPFRDIEHLLRLAAVFAVGLAAFGVARAMLVPDDFGRLGHYRAGAVVEAQAREPVYAGQQACADCHDAEVAARARSRHAAVACESCHGPLAAHAKAPGEAVLARQDARVLCVRCHAANTGKPKWYRTVAVADHAGDEPCISCHQPHDPRLSQEP